MHEKYTYVDISFFKMKVITRWKSITMKNKMCFFSNFYYLLPFTFNVDYNVNK